MRNFKEWLSDNLRYFVLFFLAVILIVAGVFGVMAIRRIGGKSTGMTKETEARQTEQSTEQSSDIIVSPNTDGLVENDTKVLTLMTSYYTAKTNKDIETLVKIDPAINQAEEIENLENTYVESYTNIRTYSKQGPTAGSCVVYVCYDGKVKDIDTLVPSLVQYYLKTDTEGNYYISDPTDDTEAQAFVDESKKSEEAQKLITEVNEACQKAIDSDPVLKEFMNKYSNSGSTAKEDAGEQETEGQETESAVPSKRQWMIANDDCNVREKPNTDCEVIGYLLYNQDIEAIGKEGDWYKIDYNGQEAYVSAEFLSTEEEFLAAKNQEEQQEEVYDDGSQDYYYDEYSDDGYYDEQQY